MEQGDPGASQQGGMSHQVGRGHQETGLALGGHNRTSLGVAAE